ncbi:MAG: glutamine amidotransferase [Dehalococcoidia bacterium]|nr:glutamine amidotransferase [Dehalococcoidia bacterium]
MSGGPEQTIRVVDLYPEVMNVYADRGNVIALRARCRALGIGCEATAVGLGDPLPAEADLVLIGGGQDREQRRIAGELASRAGLLREWADGDTPMLAVCGGFQLFGRFYRTAEGDELIGTAVFDAVTVAPARGAARCIGDVLAQSGVEGVGEVVGFENHAGRTYLGPGAEAFARVLHGHGNNGDDRTEGALYREAIGTYLHGSLLPKNMALTDRLILGALRHRYGDGGPLPAIDDIYAERAHRTAATVARERGRSYPR